MAGGAPVSGGAGARRPRAGGCVRSQLCRRSGRSRLCSRSARSCTAAHAGSVLGTHRCLQVGATGGSFARAPAYAAPLACGLLGYPGSRASPSPSTNVGSWPGCHPPPRPGSPTHRAREASSWKPPGHSHTAPPGRGTQRPLTQRHSSESSSELSSSVPAGKMQTSTYTSASRRPGTPRPQSPACVLPPYSPRGGFPSSRGLASQKELLSLCDVGHWDPGRGGTVSHTDAAPWLPPPPPYSSANPFGRLRGGSPEPRGGQGRHWAPQPRPWRQQQSSKVRAGPARGPAHMPSSPRWAQHTSRRSGARSAGGDRASGGGPKPGQEARLHPTLAESRDPGAPPRGPGPGIGPGQLPPSPAGLSGSWQSRPEGPGTQGGRHSQR